MTNSDLPELGKCPDSLSYWTADEVAECLEYHKFLTLPEANALYAKLWKFLEEAAQVDKQTPLGGDGSDGTVETPEDRLDLRCLDKAVHWWDRLTYFEQLAIVKAAKLEEEL